MEPTDQEYTVCFLYAQLRAEIVRCLTEYTKTERGSLAELKDRFSPSLSEEEKRRIKNVKQLIKAVEEKGVIGQRNVKYIKILAEWLHLEELVKIIEKYERVCFGIVQRAFKAAAKTPAVVWEIIKEGVKTSAIHLKAVLSCRGVQVTGLAVTFLGVCVMSPETGEKLPTLLDLCDRVLKVLQGSVVFVLKVSSIASIKRLWKSYKDGSLEKSMKKDLNEIKELKELSKGEEIDVELTIDEDEYHEVFWNLILSEVKANDARENVEKQPSLISRRHSVGCEQDVSRLAASSNLPGVSQLHVRPWRHVDELNKVLNNFKSIKAKIEASEDTAIELKEVASMVEQEEKRLSEIRQELSELNIVIDATGFEKVKVEEKAGLTVEGIDSGASTSLQAEKDKKQSDQSTQVPHPDQMTGDEKLSTAADARKAGEKLEEQSVVAICDKERMSETQQLLLKERFPFFKDDIIPTELLDNLPCLTNEQKDQIANDEKNHLPSKAVETLVEKLTEHKEGFEQFVEALRKAELGHVAALLDANYFDIPIIVRIKGQMKLERDIASKFSNSFSKEAKKLRQDFEKMLPRGIYFVRTKLMEDVSAKDEGTKTTGAQDVPHNTEDSLAVVFRVNTINLLDKLWKMYKDRRLDELFQSVWSKELSSSFVELFFQEEDYIECKRILKEDVKAQPTPIALESSTFENVKAQSTPLASESSTFAIGRYISVQVASLLKEYLDKEGYNNWLKVGFTLDLIRKELQSHIETETKAFHRELIAKLQGFPPCICSYMPSRRPNPYHDMKTCSWAKELEKHHRKQSPAWNQSDASLWKHRDVGHREVAKLFISPQAIVKKGAIDLEIDDLLTILSTCDHFEIDEAVVQDLKTVRNAWVHAVDQEIDEEKTEDAFEKMKRFLKEAKLLADEKQLKKVELLETEPLVFRETKDHRQTHRGPAGTSEKTLPKEESENEDRFGPFTSPLSLTGPTAASPDLRMYSRPVPGPMTKIPPYERKTERALRRTHHGTSSLAIAFTSTPPSESETVELGREVEVYLGGLGLRNIGASEAASKVTDLLQLDKHSVIDPPSDIVVKCRRFCLYLKQRSRQDIVDNLKRALPSGMTGPRRDENMLFKDIKTQETKRLTQALCGDMWKMMAEELGIPNEEIVFYDIRASDPADAILREEGRFITVGTLYDVLVRCGAAALADEYL